MLLSRCEPGGTTLPNTTPSVVLAVAPAEQREKLARVLATAGLEVVTAMDGAEVERFAAGLAPTFVVVEANLPDLDLDRLLGRLHCPESGRHRTWTLAFFAPGAPRPIRRRAGLFALGGDRLTPQHLGEAVRLALFARATGCEANDYLDAAYGDLASQPPGELLQAVASHRLSGRLVLAVAEGAGVRFEEGELVDAWWGTARGCKAFNRVATHTGDRFVVRLDAPAGGRTIHGNLESLVNDALDEAFRLQGVLSRLPSLAATVRVNPVNGLVAGDLDPLESEVLSRALRAATLSELMEWVAAPDSAAASAVESLCRRGLLTLEEV